MLREAHNHLSNLARIRVASLHKMHLNCHLTQRLRSSTDSVIISCAIDVLKLRSGYGHTFLTKQKTHALSLSRAFTIITIAIEPNILWRDSIVLVEPDPSSSFLESVHKGYAGLVSRLRAWFHVWAHFYSGFLVSCLGAFLQ